MSVTVKYLVKKPFKYNGEMLEKDAEFIPGKGKFDDQIIESDLVYEERVRVNPRRKSRKKAGSK